MPDIVALPRYRSHKVVSALKIAMIEFLIQGAARIAPAEIGFGVFNTSPDYRSRFHGVIGFDLGYYVLYEDGYESWSPTKAFEAGYTALPPRQPYGVKCLVHGCENTCDQGTFVGDLCAPCHSLITKGPDADSPMRGHTFIHQLIRQNREVLAGLARIQAITEVTTLRGKAVVR